MPEQICASKAIVDNNGLRFGIGHVTSLIIEDGQWQVGGKLRAKEPPMEDDDGLAECLNAAFVAMGEIAGHLPFNIRPIWCEFTG